MTDHSNIVRVPTSRSVAEREAKRTMTRALTLIDEVDIVINLILSDETIIEEWALHSDPLFDEDSYEGSVDIDKTRLADIVRKVASSEGNTGRFPQIVVVKTRQLQIAVQYALRRTGESL